LDEIVWAVNPKNDTLENLANYICRHAGDYFQHTDVQCRFEIPLQVPDHSLSTDARHNLFLAVKEALHNALKHSGATEVRVRIEVRDRTLAVTLTDNGGGFAAALAPPDLPGGHRVGNGLANMRQRLESIGGHCAIASEPGQGTTVTLTLGLTPDLYPPI
jgi:signal transduction histidine kinase